MAIDLRNPYLTPGAMALQKQLRQQTGRQAGQASRAERRLGMAAEQQAAQRRQVALDTISKLAQAEMEAPDSAKPYFQQMRALVAQGGGLDPQAVADLSLPGEDERLRLLEQQSMARMAGPRALQQQRGQQEMLQGIGGAVRDAGSFVANRFWPDPEQQAELELTQAKTGKTRAETKKLQQAQPDLHRVRMRGPGGGTVIGLVDDQGNFHGYVLGQDGQPVQAQPSALDSMAKLTAQEKRTRMLSEAKDDFQNRLSDIITVKTSGRWEPVNQPGWFEGELPPEEIQQRIDLWLSGKPEAIRDDLIRWIRTGIPNYQPNLAQGQTGMGAAAQGGQGVTPARGGARRDKVDSVAEKYGF